MKPETLDQLVASLTHALGQLNSTSGDSIFLRRELSEIRDRVLALKTQSLARAGSSSNLVKSSSAKLAIEEAVTLVRRETVRLSPAELVVLSKLLVLQSLLCTPRFEALR